MEHDAVNLDSPNKLGRRVPLLTAVEVCRRLSISPRRLDDWEEKVPLPYFFLGKAHRYQGSVVESALRRHRFGPPLPTGIDHSELRHRLKAKEVCNYLCCSRKTLKRRMVEGSLPYYRIGQSYRFVLEEIERVMGLEPLLPVTPIPDFSPLCGPVAIIVPFTELCPVEFNWGKHL